MLIADSPSWFNSSCGEYVALSFPGQQKCLFTPIFSFSLALECRICLRLLRPASQISLISNRICCSHMCGGERCSGRSPFALAWFRRRERDGWSEFSIAGTPLAVSGGGRSHSPSAHSSLCPPFSQGTLPLFFSSCVSCTRCMCTEMIKSACFISAGAPDDLQ